MTKLIASLAAITLLVVAVVTASAQAPLMVTGCVQSTTGCFNVTSTNGLPVAIVPGGTGTTPVVSGSLEASHVLKASTGELQAVYAVNLTGGASGWLEVFNATSAPADGAVTPIDCAPFTAGVAQLASSGMAPTHYSVGIVAVVSSSTTCFTKTTGTLTAFINGKVQ